VVAVHAGKRGWVISRYASPLVSSWNTGLEHLPAAPCRLEFVLDARHLGVELLLQLGALRLDAGGVVGAQGALFGVRLGLQALHLGGRPLAARLRQRQLRRHLLHLLLVLHLQLPRLGAKLLLVRYLA